MVREKGSVVKVSRALLSLVLLSVFITLVGMRPSHGEAISNLTNEEAQYTGKVATLASMMGDSSRRVAALTNAPRVNDLDWQNDFLGETSVWKALYLEAQDIEAPDRFKDIQDTTVEAFALYDQAATQTRAAIEALDFTALGPAGETVAAGSAKLQEATAMVAELNNS